jgi:hypothetical protein
LNEHEWLLAVDPTEMLNSAPCITERKWRLFACAVTRRYWSILRYPAPRQAVEFAENYAEEIGTQEELLERRRLAEMAAMNAPSYDRHIYLAALATLNESAIEAAQTASQEVLYHVMSMAAEEAAPYENERQVTDAAAARENQQHCELLRELLGNPFRNTTMDPAWLQINSGSAGHIATWIRQEWRFAELPYLGDALEDAGCEDEFLLRHLRQREGHVRGCWALDLILGLK